MIIPHGYTDYKLETNSALSKAQVEDGKEFVFITVPEGFDAESLKGNLLTPNGVIPVSVDNKPTKWELHSSERNLNQALNGIFLSKDYEHEFGPQITTTVSVRLAAMVAHESKVKLRKRPARIALPKNLRVRWKAFGKDNACISTNSKEVIAKQKKELKMQKKIKLEVEKNNQSLKLKVEAGQKTTPRKKSKKKKNNKQNDLETPKNNKQNDLETPKIEKSNNLVEGIKIENASFSENLTGDVNQSKIAKKRKHKDSSIYAKAENEEGSAKVGKKKKRKLSSSEDNNTAPSKKKKRREKQ